MADKYTAELKRYIQNQVRKGYDKEIVVKHLLKSGISRRQIAEAAYDVKPKKRKKSFKLFKTNFWIYAAIVVLVLIVFVFGVIYFSPVHCTTYKCFTGKANNCNAATFENQIEGTTFFYETNGCVLTKTVKAMDPSEPKAVVNTFLGKSMRCRYNKNDFSPLFLNSITGGLEACTGPLKDAVLAFAG